MLWYRNYYIKLYSGESWSVDVSWTVTVSFLVADHFYRRKREHNSKRMGSSNSIAVIPTEWMDIFRAMQLKKSEIKTLYKLYKQYDFDRRGGNSKGGMDMVEWLTLIDIERTALSERIFYAADRDGDHRLNFFEFVVSLWKFCVLGDGSLSKQNSLIFLCCCKLLTYSRYDFWLCIHSFPLKTKQMCLHLTCLIPMAMAF